MSSSVGRILAAALSCALALFTVVFGSAAVASADSVPQPGSPGPLFSPSFSTSQFSDPAGALRPKYRWWQPVADTSDAQLRAEVQAMAADGGGGFEQNGFPVTMNSDGQTPQFETYANSQQFNAIFGWGTPAWSDRTAAYETAAAQNGVLGDMTEGSRWNNSVPSVFSQNQPAAAQQLVFGDAQLQPGDTPSGELPSVQTQTSDGTFGPTTIGEVSGVSTELCQSAAAGDTNLKLQSVAGLLAGDRVTLGLGSGAETATIKRVGTASPCVPLSQNARAGASVVHVPLPPNDSNGSGGLGVVGQTSAARSGVTGVDGTGMEPAQFTAGEQISVGAGSARETDTIARVGTYDIAAPTTLAGRAASGTTNVEVASTSGFLRGDTITFDAGQPDQQSRTITAVGASGTGTTLAKSGATGDLGISVASTAGLSAGNQIVIDPGHSDQETVTIANVTSAGAPADNVLLQDATLAHGHASGEPVVLAGIGVSFSPGLTGAVAGGTTATDTGTGLFLSHPLAHAHTLGDALVAPGSGVTLTAPLSKDHAAGPNTATQTTVAVPSARGATTITVASAAGLAAGDKITIGPSGFGEDATITSIGSATSAGTPLTLSAALTMSHFAGDPVLDATSRATGTTTLAAAAAPGVTNLKVISVARLSPGDALALGASGSVSEITTVKAVGTAGASGTGVTLTAGLSDAHAAGATVSDSPGANAGAGVSDIARTHLVAVEFAQCTGSDASTCPSAPTGGTRDLDPSSVQVVTARVSDGTLHYTTNGGRLPLGNGNPWEELVFYETADGQTLGGATASAPAYWLDHLSVAGARAMGDYFDAHILNNPATVAAIRSQDIHTGKPAVFEDSLELSASLKWTPKMLSQWSTGLGYDPVTLLAAIAGQNQSATGTPLFDFPQNDGHGASLGWRVREDYRQLWSDVYTGLYQQTLDNWASGHGLVARFQAYGDPIDAGAASAHSGIPEGEHLEFGGDDETQQFKVVASGAYQTGNNVVSDECCEEFGTTFGGTYGVDGTGSGPEGSSILSSANSAYADIAGGDSQIIWHGWPYNPYPAGAAAVWPGNSFAGDQLVSAANGPNNPTFSDNRQDNLALARVALAMRQGAPGFDVAVYHQDLGLAGQAADSLATGENLGNRVSGGQTFTPTTGQVIRSSSSLAQTGYTYGYVSPEFFAYPTARYGRDRSGGSSGSGGDGRVLFPGHGNYSSLVIYNQSVMPVDAAQKILALARGGLPVVIIGPVPDATASASPGTVSGFAARDALVQAAMAKLTALPNVKVVSDATGAGSQSQDENAPAALHSLGITPSTGLTPTSTSGTAQPVLTERRHDTSTDTDYYFLFNPDLSATVYPTVDLAGHGQPYLLNTWSAQVTPIAAYDRSHGHVGLSIRIAPGNFALVAISRRNLTRAHILGGLHATSTTANATEAETENVVYEHGRLVARASRTGTYATALSNGRSVKTPVTVPRIGGSSGPLTLSDWQLSVDSWGPTPSGDPTQTQHTRIPTSGTFTVKPLASSSDGSLPSWTDITPQNGFPVPDNLTNVAGVGTYATSFSLPSGWSTRSAGAFLNIGVAVDTVDIQINGTPVSGIDQNDRNQIDVGPYLRAGTNTLRINVATPLQNAVDVAPAVPATGQVANSSETIGSLQGGGGGSPFGGGTSKDANMGLIGPVTLTPYGQRLVTAGHGSGRSGAVRRGRRR
jgi:hypothetical protein